MKDKPIYMVLASVLLTATLVLAGVLVGSKLGDSSHGAVPVNQSLSTEVSSAGREEAPAVAGASNDGIAIPGFEKLVLKAGELEQKVGFYNPEQNTCYFRIFFTLADGTELYTSGMIKPGQVLDTVELFRPLEAGIYEGAVLRYECFSMETLNPLNGAETILELEVLQ
jgi:hypothetical protein